MPARGSEQLLWGSAHPAAAACGATQSWNEHDLQAAWRLCMILAEMNIMPSGRPHCAFVPSHGTA